MTEKAEQRQRVILKFVAQYQDSHDYPPSTREIQQRLRQRFGRASTATVYSDIQELIQAGLLRHRESQRRATVITGRGRERVAAWQRQLEGTSDGY
ncbi:transcriptional repressor [Lacticaseibacillus paracasei subsp. tolerans]|uniref:LexA family protein n=1 Tax=Lacticaseibacillus paracasei TaxID=1597 RepID=UPI0018AD42F4|nr:transcriptional repressor [Lacticaseibacillus paracasei]QPI89314.1 transcriptional repressor [Lacticaseibacillus paracasei subsp. tolerans]